jgi:hypothetical protein
MVVNLDQLFVLNDEAFVEASFNLIHERPPSAEEMALYVTDLRVGHGKDAIVGELADLLTQSDLESKGPELARFLNSLKKRNRWKFFAFGQSRRSDRRQLNRIENSLGRILQLLTRVDLSAKTPSDQIGSVGTSDEPSSRSSALIGSNALILTPSELSSLPPAAREVFREISRQIEQTGDSLDL